MKAVSQWSSIRSAASFANKADDASRNASIIAQRDDTKSPNVQRKASYSRQEKCIVYLPCCAEGFPLQITPGTPSPSCPTRVTTKRVSIEAWTAASLRYVRGGGGGGGDSLRRENAFLLIFSQRWQMFFGITSHPSKHLTARWGATILTRYARLTITARCKQASVMYTTPGAVTSHDWAYGDGRGDIEMWGMRLLIGEVR